MIQYWSYILAPFGLFGLYLAGRKIAYGWLFGLVTQSLWLAYSVQTEQWGFIPGTLAYSWIYLKNFLAWRREKETKTDDEDHGDPDGSGHPAGRAGRAGNGRVRA